MKQTFSPQPGKVAVILEASVTLKRAAASDIEVLDETEKYEKWINPWALVVGVGAPAIADTGREITTDVKPGEKVAISQVGRNLPLVSADGQVEYVYVLPFEGILGRLERECEKCGFTSRESADDMECPQCPKIVAPTALDMQRAKRSKR